jgi:hypothetical protein
VLPFYLAEMAMGSTMTFTRVNCTALLGIALFSSVLA